MYQKDEFAELRQEEENFSLSHGLETQVLGNHPYIRSELLRGSDHSPFEIIFVSKIFELDTLNLLTQKIIDSFGVVDSDYKVINILEDECLADVLEKEKMKSKIVVLFNQVGDFRHLRKLIHEM